MILAHNLESMNTNRQYKIVTKNKEKAAERLASGYKINRAADNAAGLAISEKMRSQVRGLKRAERNVQEGINFVQTADGALSEIQAMMHRVHELAVQAANDTNTDEDRKFIDEEIQMYKEEINYIFEETEYNTIKIWDTNTDNRVQIGIEKKKAVNIANSGNTISYFSVNEKNKGKIAYSGYKIDVKGTDKEKDPDNYGFMITWTGWDNENYQTKLISWDDVVAQGGKSFSCKLSAYVDTVADPDLAGIDFPIRWTSEETATIDDIAASIDGMVFGSYVDSRESTLIKNQAHPGVSFSINTYYLAELSSGRNVENYDTAWIEPEPSGGPNVASMPSYTDVTEKKGWEIQFNMPNIGLVKAASTSVSYHGTVNGPEGKWWYRSNNGNIYYHSYSPGVGSDGTLLGVSDCITNSTNKVHAKGGGMSLTHDDTQGGVITVYFDLTAGGTYTYKNRTSDDNRVGSISMNITVNKEDTEDDIMKKIQTALNANTVFDAYEGYEASGTPYQTTERIYEAYANNHMIDVPVYETYHDRAIQSGANTDQAIHLIYKSLRLMNLGIHDSNVLTREAASQAITDVQAALDIVSEQRSLFGAYQNRMEYAEKNDANGAENTQAAESRIRDADMADEMVVFSKESILQQAATSMLAQANQSKQGILSLLNG